MGNRILITGKGSYIGDMFKAYATEYGDSATTLNMLTGNWKDCDFSCYDVVIHVAAIVHKQEVTYTEEEYHNVNTQLVYDVAKKAKESGVKQFVFLSTMSVYGVVNGVITKHTECKPFNNYGKSKLEAEHLLTAVADDNFTVTVLRPPIVYGKGCKGNYVELSKFAKKLPLFPDYNSQRSMIYIGNLCSFIKKAIDERLSGIYCPQDECYVRTSEMVSMVAHSHGKRIKLTKFFNPLITLALKLKINIVCKVFGSLTYEKDLCPQYDTVDLETAIRLTEE